MNKILLLLTLLSILILSCENKPNQISLFNDISFSLNSEETIINNKSSVKNLYLSYFYGQTSIQIPLYRAIEGRNYTIFIGIPYQSSIMQVVNFKLTGLDTCLISTKTDSISYNFKKYKTQKDYLTEYTIDINNNLIHILTVSNSEKVADSLFNFYQLSKRIKLNK